MLTDITAWSSYLLCCGLSASQWGTFLWSNTTDAREINKVQIPCICSWSRSRYLLGLGLKPSAASLSFSCRRCCSSSLALLSTSSCSSSSSLRPAGGTKHHIQTEIKPHGPHCRIKYRVIIWPETYLYLSCRRSWHPAAELHCSLILCSSRMVRRKRKASLWHSPWKDKMIFTKITQFPIQLTGSM